MNPLKSYVLRENFDYPSVKDEITDQVMNSSQSNSTQTLNVSDRVEQRSLQQSDNLQHVQEYMIEKFISHFNSLQNILKNHNYDININQIIKPNGDVINNSFNVIIYLMIERLERPEFIADLIKTVYGSNYNSQIRYDDKQQNQSVKTAWIRINNKRQKT